MGTPWFWWFSPNADENDLEWGGDENDLEWGGDAVMWGSDRIFWGS